MDYSGWKAMHSLTGAPLLHNFAASMRQTTIFDLPAEVLCEIFTQCDNPAIWETCNTFAKVAFSTTSLWATVYICPHQFTTDAPDILRERISRARGRLLDVHMWLTTECWHDTPEVSALCKVFSEFNAQIRCFKLTAATPKISGAVIHDVFPKPQAMPALEVLSILSEQGTEDLGLPAIWPELSSVLVNASTMFPNPRKLHMNIFHRASRTVLTPRSSRHFSIARRSWSRYG